MASGNQQAYGSLIGTTSAIDVETVGWKPREVRCINIDSGDELAWFETMDDDSGFKRVAAGAGAQILSGGITPLVNGFTFGADSDMNDTGEIVHWVASQ